MQTKHALRLLTLSVLIAATTQTLFSQSYDPVPGGEVLDRLRSPLFLSTTEHTTSTESVAGDVVNPATSALKQRIHLDGSYLSIVGNGALGGHAANLGATFPTRFGVFSGSGNFARAGYDALNIGTRGSINLSFAKDLYPNLLVGTGVRTHFSSHEGTFGVGAGLDLGMIHRLGSVGPLGDVRWGLTLSQLGIAPSTSGGTSGSPAPFTPAADIAATVLDTEMVDIAPSYRHFRAYLSEPPLPRRIAAVCG